MSQEPIKSLNLLYQGFQWPNKKSYFTFLVEFQQGQGIPKIFWEIQRAEAAMKSPWSGLQRRGMWANE